MVKYLYLSHRIYKEQQTQQYKPNKQRTLLILTYLYSQMVSETISIKYPPQHQITYSLKTNIDDQLNMNKLLQNKLAL